MSGSVRLFDCPSCGGTIALRAAGHSIEAICLHCGATVDVANPSLKLIREATQAVPETLIDIGARGTLEGIPWEVIGYVLKSDGPGVYFWEEYLLFNPWHGFRFLSQSAGHWSLARLLKVEPEGGAGASALTLDGTVFQRILSGRAIVQAVKGEFYWRTRVGESVEVRDYIAPPRMLSVEISAAEISYSLGTYVPREVVAEAFSIPIDVMPPVKGVGAHQPPPPLTERLHDVVRTAMMACAAAIVVCLVQWGMFPEARVLGQVFDWAPSQRDQTYVSPPFEITRRGAVAISMEAPALANDWAEASVSLTNEATDETSSVILGMEFYSGYDDGYWTEGSRQATGVISAVPPGTYTLAIDVDAGAFTRGQSIPLGVAVDTGAMSVGSLALALGLIMAWPLLLLILRIHFEHRRQADNADG